jgi:hypothetical protein
MDLRLLFILVALLGVTDCLAQFVVSALCHQTHTSGESTGTPFIAHSYPYGVGTAAAVG